jgi:hypothetical protein
MSDLLAGLITILLVLWLTAFVLALLSLRTLPLGERPRTPTYDRYGALLGQRENPDYHEQPGEAEASAGES